MLAYRRNLAPILPPISAPTPTVQRRVKIPDEITDPLGREILELIRSHPQTWVMTEADAGVGFGTVRMWFYRRQSFNPKFALVQAVLAVLGWRLVLQRISD